MIIAPSPQRSEPQGSEPQGSAPQGSAQRSRALPVLLLLAALPAFAQTPAPADSVRSIARGLIAQNDLPGLSVAVGVRGEIVYSEGFGLADLENQVPVTRETRFRIGSVSKSVTSVALAQLAEQGKLDLDQPVQRYVPQFPQKRWPITVRQVAGHIAGVRHYRGNENTINTHYPNVIAALDIFKDDSLQFEPGTKYAYSSYGWNLLSAVIQNASGEDFLGYMRRHVFDPPGLRSITAEHVDSLIAHRARFYERGAISGLTNAPFVDNSYKWAGGGFISNTEDLVRLAFALMRPGLLQRPESLDLLWTSQKLRDGTATNYGMGWFSAQDPAGRPVIYHTGGSVGGRAVLVIWPQQGVVVAMLSNAGHAPMSLANAAKIGALYLPR